MKLRALIICFIIVQMITGCKSPDIVTPKSRILRTMAAMRQGQTVQWDESVTDTVSLPTSLADSSADFRNQCFNRQVKTYHVVASIPDSLIPHFQITRSVTQYAQRDTMGGRRVGKVVTYGNQFTTYDQNDNSISTTTLDVSNPAEDFADLPFFEMRPDTVVTDSERTKFVDIITSSGGIVTNLGSDGYKVEKSFMED